MSVRAGVALRQVLVLPVHSLHDSVCAEYADMVQG